MGATIEHTAKKSDRAIRPEPHPEPQTSGSKTVEPVVRRSPMARCASAPSSSTTPTPSNPMTAGSGGKGQGWGTPAR